METRTQMWQDKNASLGKPALVLLCLSAMVFSISIFVYGGVLRGLDAVRPQSPAIDFYFWYSAGQLWNEGPDPYDYDMYRSRFGRHTGESRRAGAGYYSPPQATVLFALLAKLPLRTAHLVLLGANLSFLFVSLCMLALILSWHRPIGLVEITLLVTFVGTGFGRMNVRERQTGLLMSFS